ncbi:zf-HC2 domain-containing protein [Gemmiger formicilis]|uniref:zf-HC2 domain-containing protein n=1 Tax=Gemmiger formicilis TaxID=745368 RepID=UPI00195CD826|nr:zf-HC2 domain-containing protein [Gemmiger formicilis]MBM6715126.1 zf-HC2 domain-containing protein [Gemmiger formicilis]
MTLPCYLVRDLLPLYHDNLCAPDTAKDVSKHLETCESCRTALQALDMPDGASPTYEEEDLQRAQALQLLHRRLLRSRVLTVLVSALAVLLLLVAGAYFTHAYFSTRYLDADPAALQVSRENDVLYLASGSGVKANRMSATVCEYGGDTVVVFSVYGSVWDSWFGSGLPAGGLNLVRNGEVKKAYYLPYRDYLSVFDRSDPESAVFLTENSELTALPPDAVLMWQAGTNG